MEKSGAIRQPHAKEAKLCNRRDGTTGLGSHCDKGAIDSSSREQQLTLYPCFTEMSQDGMERPSGPSLFYPD